jgi:uridine phosphorylase
MEFKPSELILNPDGSIFHLRLQPEHIADTIILVGDPKRVDGVSSMFDTVDLRVSNREFITHTGTFRGNRLTAMSTGIGADNVDIVLNELDALVNIDLKLRRMKEQRRTLRLVRIGTTGGLQKDIPVDSIILSRYAAGFDTVMNFYSRWNEVSEEALANAFREHTGWDERLHSPCFIRSSDELFERFAGDVFSGITITAPGFYGPQGRSIRLEPADPGLNDKLESFRYGDLRILNYEMESSALFGLSRLLGHQAATLCTMIANRATLEFTADYKASVSKLIKFTLEHLF